MQNPYKQRQVSRRKIDEQRLVMEEAIGRRLGRHELVHHINGDRFDNRLENLQIVTAAEHAEIHQRKHPLTKVCASCGEPYTPPLKHRGRSQTCSQECRYALVSAKLRTPDSPNSMYREGAYPSQVASQRKARPRSRQSSSKQ